MNKKEQKIYTEAVRNKVRERGLKMGYFLNKIGISSSHWHFIKKGDRPLTNENISKIEHILSK